MCYLRRPKAYLWNDASWYLASFISNNPGSLVVIGVILYICNVSSCN